MSQRTQLWASGGGTQSAAVAALIVRGDIAPPDLAVIVDTGRELSSTWEYMDQVITPNLAKVGVKLHRVKTSSFESRSLYGGKDGQTFLMPAFTTINGQIGKLSNFCSSYWKREIIKRWATKVHKVGATDVWLGISVDEMDRMQAPRKGKWNTRYPLIEARMNRGNCVALVVDRMGWPAPPRSRCRDCPNQTQEEWRDTRDNRPKEWQQVVRFDRGIRKRDAHLFLHSDAVPLDEANLDDANGVLFGHGCTSGHCFT